MRTSKSIEDPADLYGVLGQVVARRFRVLALQHAGPRGHVYEVEPPGVGQSRRALKVLGLPEAREPEAIERLHVHVDRVQGLEHPHAERVYELGTLPDGAAYLVTEWLPFDSLDDAIAHGGRLPLARALQVVAAVAEGLAALHQRGVVHGDVRPEHVLVSPAREGYARVVLVDGGIAARLETRLPPGLKGPLAFLSPQRAKGRVSASDDVYALGALAYFLLTGVHPFEADDPRGRAASLDPVERVRWLHENALPIRLARRAPVPDLDPQVEAVVGRALAKDVAVRYEDGGAFLQALDEAQAGRGETRLEGLFTDEAAPTASAAPPAPAPRPPLPRVKVLETPIPLPASGSRTGVWVYVVVGVVVGALLAWML